jgi:hypothetical protein
LKKRGGQRAGERVMAGIEQFPASQQGQQRGRTAARARLLSLSFTIGKKLKRRHAPHTRARFKTRVRKVTRGFLARWLGLTKIAIAIEKESCKTIVRLPPVMNLSVRRRDRWAGRTSGSERWLKPGLTGGVWGVNK